MGGYYGRVVAVRDHPSGDYWAVAAILIAMLMFLPDAVINGLTMVTLVTLVTLVAYLGGVVVRWT